MNCKFNDCGWCYAPKGICNCDNGSVEGYDELADIDVTGKKIERVNPKGCKFLKINLSEFSDYKRCFDVMEMVRLPDADYVITKIEIHPFTNSSTVQLEKLKKRVGDNGTY